MRVQNSAFTEVVLAKINNQRNGVIWIIDAMQFMDTASEESKVIRKQSLVLPSIYEYGIGLPINKPNSLDAGLE